MAAIIESIRQFFFKRREEYKEQSKQKIDVISKATPYYNQLSMNSWNFGWILNEGLKKPDYKRLMYHMCNILYIRHEIVNKFGDLQFDNLDAEKIINCIWQQINSLVEGYFGYLDSSKLRCLVENDIPYHKFHESLNQNGELYNKFVNWISTEISSEDLHKLEERCLWYSQLIQLELNHIYKSWYGQEPPLELRYELKKYLDEKNPTYYKRIKSFHLRTSLQTNSTHSESE
ncbi:MAG: hypothetical protein WCF03_16460 [Nitrososphaeraceae archaeon]